MTSDSEASAYAGIIRSHLTVLFQEEAPLIARYPGVTSSADGLELIAFGRPCRLSPQGIFIDGRCDWGPRGVILALLGRHAVPDAPVEKPWRAFRELPNSAPYVGAFRTHTEQLLVPHVTALCEQRAAVTEAFNGRPPEEESPADWSLVVDPLPPIALCYHFYLPDEDFPANATCLYSNNAHRFLPTDALADVGEYMSRALIGHLG